MIICFFYICVDIVYITAWWNWRNFIKNRMMLKYHYVENLDSKTALIIIMNVSMIVKMIHLYH